MVGDLGLPGAYTGEVAWYGSGGGLSYFETKPAFQSSLIPARRGVPDVALDADPTTGYTVVVSGKQMTIGGTSASAPAWNGYWARALGARGALGPAGPRLYAAKTGFHDIVLGTNGLFPATPGYDYTTGLGTPDLTKLIPAL
jgi:subtilase family serine protease